jgi:hypothetical protein
MLMRLGHPSSVIVFATVIATAPVSAATAAPLFGAAEQGTTPAAPQAAGQFEDVEERKGPFVLAGRSFTVVLHSKRLPGKTRGDSETLASLDILDAGGVVQHHEDFPHAVENGEFTDTCSVGIQPLSGSNGQGLLLDTGCLPSAPLSGGPWQVFGVVKGKLIPFGKPIVAEGEMGDFTPGAVSRIGNLTQILPDMLRIRLFTGYFFVSVPIRIDWIGGKLALGQHCLYQTGHGFAEGGCEMAVEGVERHPGEEELTFVRLFNEASEASSGTPAHVVVKKDSTVEFLSASVLTRWDEEPEVISLSAGEDIWVKVRIDGKVGWIHTDEDLNAIGLYRTG